MRNTGRLIYRPFSLLYIAFLAFLFFTLAGAFLSFFRGLLVNAVGIPQEYFWAITLLSLIGSLVNLPLFVMESPKPVTYLDEINVFGIRRLIPYFESKPKETLVMVNLGGAIIPVLISGYLLLFSIPSCSPNLMVSYLQALIVLVLVTLSTNQSAQVVDGLGITTPAWGPPTMTAFVVFLMNYLVLVVLLR